jgi:Domain of unknown function (DUF4261)
MSISPMRTLSSLILLLSFQITLSAQAQKNQHVVSGIVMVNDKLPLDAKALFATLKSDWKVKADSLNIADKTIVFSTSGATVMISQLHYTADPIEIRAAAQLSWLWTTATQEALRHQSQVVISVMGQANKSLELHQLFSKVAAAILESTHSSGVYMGSQYLLISKGFYVAAAHNMLDNQTLPVYCWVYFGRPGNAGGYTFGMSDFGLKEMEIVGSGHSEAEVHATLYEAASSVLKYNSRPLSGESIVTEEGTKIPVKVATSVFLEGQQVLQLAY